MVKSGQTRRKAARRTRKIERKAAGIETKVPGQAKEAKKTKEHKATRKLGRKSARKTPSTAIINSVRGRELELRWPVNLAWIGYVLVALYLLMLGPGALILYYMLGPEDSMSDMLSYGIMVTIQVVSLFGMILGVIAVVKTYLKAPHRMREVATLTGGAVVAILVGYWLTYAMPFHSTESYVIMFSLVALLPGAIAAMFRWLMPMFEARRELQKVATVLTVIVLAIEIVFTTGTIVATVNTVVGLNSQIEAVTETVVQDEEVQENAE